MKSIKIDPAQSYVELVAKDGVSVSDALTEAIEFCKSEELKDCTLNYKGFLFDIEPTYCVKDAEILTQKVPTKEVEPYIFKSIERFTPPPVTKIKGHKRPYKYHR